MSTEIHKHKGEIVQKKISQLGLKNREVARRMDISRGTLYNYYKKPDLNSKIILKIGMAARYDFSVHFDELIPLIHAGKDRDATKKSFVNPTTEELAHVQHKYYKLLERQDALLKFLLRIAYDYDLVALKEKVIKFMDEHFEEK